MSDADGLAVSGAFGDALTVVEVLRARGQTLATSESLTGGLVGAAITSVPGASNVYLGGAIVYATRLKAELSGASPATLAGGGVISHDTACELAVGIRERTGANWGLATTGAAGPDPQEGHAPGEVWIGVSGGGRTSAERYQFVGDRAAVREQSVRAALALLIRTIGH